jgi:hypothetical protein
MTIPAFDTTFFPFNCFSNLIMGRKSCHLDGRKKRRQVRLLRQAQRQAQQEDAEGANANDVGTEGVAAEPGGAEGSSAGTGAVVGRNSLFVGRCFPADVTEFTLGGLTEVCQFCQALRFQNETLNCCHNGKVSLQPLQPVPNELHNLFTQSNANAKNFFENIRSYNSAMAFASFGASLAPPPGYGPYCFRIHGQIYHRSGSLHPDHAATPSYSQLYIIEGDQAVETRMAHRENQNCRYDIMHLLTQVMDRVNPYAAAYKRMKQIEDEQLQQAESSGAPPPKVTMHFKQGKDVRRYNEPRHDEVAVIFVSPDGAPPADRDIVVFPRDLPPRNISYMSAHSDPMVYPLFFPFGDLGWHSALKHDADHSTDKRNTVTQLQFYSYRLAVRAIFSPLFYGGKLLQQYIVDSYVKTEAGRLDFIRRRQKDLRVELYQGLMDHIHSQAEQQNLNPGKIVILPSSFQGSPRAMQQNYQDAMAVVAKYGRPDLFITFTCNPKCRDITDSLPGGQRPENRPDIVARVFKHHLKELLHDITDKHVLGIPVGYVYVIEFQKRGLPHAHLLLILSNDSKLNNVSQSCRMSNSHSCI